MGAISSTIQLADLALVWSNAKGNADFTLIDDDLASDRGLTTAVLLSFFLDRRAENDDVIPSGDSTDRRGWWADQFAEVEGDKIGSRLWLLDRAVRTNENVQRAKEYAKEALQWMLDDKVVASLDVTAVLDSDGNLNLSVGLTRPDGTTVTLRFGHAWDQVEVDA